MQLATYLKSPKEEIMKVFNVDEYLKKNEVEIILKGKSFVVADVPFDFQETIADASADGQKEGLKKLLKCKNEDLDGYGVAAVAGIIRHITENLFPEPSQKNQ
jgi:hypothetical protein